MRLKNKSLRPQNNEKGSATIEAVPLLVIFIVLIGYGLGLFGVIHTSILNSIAARTYAFETFRNRVDLTYHREHSSVLLAHQRVPAGNPNPGVRYHYISGENVQNASSTFYATVRPIDLSRATGEVKGSTQDHNSRIYALPQRNRGEEGGGVEVNPAWIKVGYGMCVNFQCGD